jgi:hypothetical protein
VIQERIKHVTARTLTGRAPDIINVSILWKLLRKLKSTRRDSLFDYPQMLTGTEKIRFRWRSPQRWPIANALKHEIVLN